MTKAHLEELQADLDELERTDPAVKAAADSYDRMVQKLIQAPTELTDLLLAVARVAADYGNTAAADPVVCRAQARAVLSAGWLPPPP